MSDRGRRFAVLVGATAPDLRGVEEATLAMQEIADRFEFSVSLFLGENATRDNVLGRLSELKSTVKQGDAVLFYYIGHARFVAHSELTTLGGPPLFFELYGTWQSTQSEIKTLLSFELAEQLFAINEKAGNVTAVFDCCYAQGVVPRYVPEAAVIAQSMAEVLRAIERRRSEGLRKLRGTTYPAQSIVRLFATSAYDPAGGPKGVAEAGGLFTSQLVEELRRAPREATWAHIISRVRDRVLSERRHQRPVVEGPWLRPPFRLDGPTPPKDSHPCADVGEEGWVIESSEGLLARVGELYELSTLDGGWVQARVTGSHKNRVALEPEEPLPDNAPRYGWARRVGSELNTTDESLWARLRAAASETHDEVLAASITLHLGFPDLPSITVGCDDTRPQVYAAAITVDGGLWNLSAPNVNGVRIGAAQSVDILSVSGPHEGARPIQRFAVVVSDEPLNLTDLSTKRRVRGSVRLVEGPKRATWLFERSGLGRFELVSTQ